MSKNQRHRPGDQLRNRDHNYCFFLLLCDNSAAFSLPRVNVPAPVPLLTVPLYAAACSIYAANTQISEAFFFYNQQHIRAIRAIPNTFPDGSRQILRFIVRSINFFYWYSSSFIGKNIATIFLTLAVKNSTTPMGKQKTVK